MASLSVFCSKFTNENEVIPRLASQLGLRIVTDREIMQSAAQKFDISHSRLEQSLYKDTSVFNEFTLERERCASFLKVALADYLEQDNFLFNGFMSYAIPAELEHVLRILIVGNKIYRLQLASLEGYSEHEATLLTKNNDQQIKSWVNFLNGKDAFDPYLHDIVIPASQIKDNDDFRLIHQKFSSSSVYPTYKLKQAVQDLRLAAYVECALLENGHKIDVTVHDGNVLLQVNTPFYNYGKISNRLTIIAHAVKGVKGVEVKFGEQYRPSVFQDKKFDLPPKVLLVDDEIDFVNTLSDRLRIRNFGSHAVYDGQEALDFIKKDNPDVMVIDLRMPGIHGIDVLKQVKETNPQIEVIILSGHGSMENEQACMELGAFAFLHKPADLEKLSESIHAAYCKIANNNTEISCS